MQWPAFALVNQHGRKVDLHRDILAGHPVVLSFFYTKCKGSCPVTTGRMMSLATLLAEQQRPARFVSITLEPEEDTPAVLAEYAHDVLPSDTDWHLLTGEKDTITVLRRHLGFYDLNPIIDADPRRHAAMVLIGDTRTHRWITLPAISTLRQWRSALRRCIA
jgi:protein SCO1/2